jgi:YD repeat-containing protein
MKPMGKKTIRKGESSVLSQSSDQYNAVFCEIGRRKRRKWKFSTEYVKNLLFLIQKYDTKGRVTSFGETIAGSAFSTTFTYDTMGRLSTRTLPSAIVETMNYNSYGYMASISAGGSIRYTITGMNAQEQLTGATYGSAPPLNATYGFDDYGYPSSAVTGAIQDYHYSFNPLTGNLNSRENSQKGKSESFTYDALDRLTEVTGPPNLTMDYFNNGNIKIKSDIHATTNFG